MRIIRFRDFKIIKSKHDKRTYLRFIYDSVDGGIRFCAFPINRMTQRVEAPGVGEDILSDELRDYIRGQIMLIESQYEEESNV